MLNGCFLRPQKFKYALSLVLLHSSCYKMFSSLLNIFFESLSNNWLSNQLKFLFYIIRIGFAFFDLLDPRVNFFLAKLPIANPSLIKKASL